MENILNTHDPRIERFLSDLVQAEVKKFPGIFGLRGRNGSVFKVFWFGSCTTQRKISEGDFEHPVVKLALNQWSGKKAKWVEVALITPEGLAREIEPIL